MNMDLNFDPNNLTPDAVAELLSSRKKSDWSIAKKFIDRFFHELPTSLLEQAMRHSDARIRTLVFTKKALTEEERIVGVSDHDFSVVRAAAKNRYHNGESSLTPRVYDTFWSNDAFNVAQPSYQPSDFPHWTPWIGKDGPITLASTLTFDIAISLAHLSEHTSFIQKPTFAKIIHFFKHMYECAPLPEYARMLATLAQRIDFYPDLETIELIESHASPFTRTFIDDHFKRLKPKEERESLIDGVHSHPASRKNAL